MEDEEGDEADGEEGAAAVARLFGYGQRLRDEEEVEAEDDHDADEAPFLAERGEDEIGVMRRKEVELCLGALPESFSVNAAGADGDLGLRNLVALAERIAVGIEKGDDAVLLVRLHHAEAEAAEQGHDDDHRYPDPPADAAEEHRHRHEREERRRRAEI